MVGPVGVGGPYSATSCRLVDSAPLRAGHSSPEPDCGSSILPAPDLTETDRRNARAPAHDMIRAMLLGAGCSALAAYAGVRYGASLGVMVPAAAAVAGGLVLALFAGCGGRKATPLPAAGDAKAGSAESVAPSEPVVEVQPGVAPAPVVAQGPAETHEIQVKLDLARSYLEMDEAELAIPLLQEILETELAVAARLGSDAVRETR